MAPLSERLQRYYEEMGELRARSLDRLGDYFSEDIHYRDPFRETFGMPAFRRLFVSWFARYREVGFTGFRVEGDDDRFTMRYDMRLRMAVGPTFTTSMASVCRTRDGKVFDLDDYFDFPSGLVSPFPVLGRAYRGAVRLLFL